MPPHFMKPGRMQRTDRRAARAPSNRTVRVASRVRWLLASCLFVGALGLVASLTGAQSGSIVVEDWSKQPSGKRGIPSGWQGQNWGSPKYDFTTTTDDSTPAIHLKSENDSSTISRELKVDVKQYPILQWTWKVVVLPKAGDARRKETDDEAAQLYVTFPRFPQAVRSRIIGYIWDSNAPVGAIFPSQKVSTITYLVVRSGDADLGKWLTETRNVLNDFKRIYGEDPGESVGAVAISINSQNTNARAESFFGEILFRKP